jgi:hypothetical protein
MSKLWYIHTTESSEIKTVDTQPKIGALEEMILCEKTI